MNQSSTFISLSWFTEKGINPHWKTKG